MTTSSPADGRAVQRAEAPLLEIAGLSLVIDGRGGPVEILRGVSLTVGAGEMKGLVGETGSGKTMTSRAVLGLLPNRSRIGAGSIRLGDVDLLRLSPAALHAVRGRRIGAVFQNPRGCLHPMLSVERQMLLIQRSHDVGASDRERRARAREFLALVGMPDPERVARAYPHELSGGMAQRVVIASAILCEPELLIADEPTTGLDATVQLEILDVLAEMQQRLRLGVLFITHDLSIVAQYCHSVAVITEGQIVEDGTVEQVMLAPQHPYSRRLIEASRLDDVVKGGAR